MLFSDESIMSKLSFTESVLISKIESTIESREVEPKPVGGLCLSIEIVDGYIPEDREISIDEKLERDVTRILKSAKGNYCF